MSMISAQVDKLRKAAQTYRDLSRYEDEQLLLDAADTIWELRESVHRERAEVDTLRTQLADVTVSMGRVEKRCAKLREYAAKLELANIVLDSDNYDLKNDMKDMQFFIDENRKLRELVRDMGELLDMLTGCDLDCKHYHRGCIGDCYYVNARRELGVEV